MYRPAQTPASMPNRRTSAPVDTPTVAPAASAGISRYKASLRIPVAEYIRWLNSESRTWSLVATCVKGIVGMTERTANASQIDGVAMKLANDAAASYPNERREPIM